MISSVNRINWQAQQGDIVNVSQDDGVGVVELETAEYRLHTEREKEGSQRITLLNTMEEINVTVFVEVGTKYKARQGNAQQIQNGWRLDQLMESWDHRGL